MGPARARRAAGRRSSSIVRRFTTCFDTTAWNRCPRAESMQQPGWYLQRLRVMSGAEVAHRLARKMRLLSQKFVSNELPPRDEAARDLRFLPPFLCVAPEHLTAAADRVLAGKFSFFDLTDCDLGSPPQWNRDQRRSEERRVGKECRSR